MNTKIDDIKSYLEMMDKASSRCSVRIAESYYLELGRPFENRPFTPRELKAISGVLALYGSYRTGECYYNAAGIALADPSLKFVEGIAMGPIPLSHAWVEFEGRPIDVTWPATYGSGKHETARTATQIAERIRVNLRDSAYWGVTIPTKMLRSEMLRRKIGSPIFDGQYLRDPEVLRIAKALTDGKFPATIV